MPHRAKLHLATMEDLETSQSQQPARNHLHRQAKSPGQAATNHSHFHVGQLLYAKDVYKDYPAWKRWVANNVHIPLFRFIEKTLGLFPPTGKRPDGTYVWAAHQGCFESREQADIDAARYPHGYVVPNVPVGRSLTADVAQESSIYFARNKREEATKADEVSKVINEARRDVANARATIQTARAF